MWVFFMVLLHESQTVNSFKQGVHDQWLRSTELVELNLEVAQQLLHLNGVLCSVLMVLNYLLLEKSGLLDVINCQVLAFSDLQNLILVNGPLDPDQVDHQDGGEDQEPDE